MTRVCIQSGFISSWSTINHIPFIIWSFINCLLIYSSLHSVWFHVKLLNYQPPTFFLVVEDSSSVLTVSSFLICAKVWSSCVMDTLLAGALDTHLQLLMAEKEGGGVGAGWKTKSKIKLMLIFFTLPRVLLDSFPTKRKVWKRKKCFAPTSKFQL